MLATKVGLSPLPCLRRVKALEESGIIHRYVAVLNPQSIGMHLTLFVRVWLDGQDEDTVNHFCREVKLLAEVVECHLMVGDCDFLLRVITTYLPAYRALQTQNLTRIAGVRSIKTEITMQIIKQSTELPLG